MLDIGWSELLLIGVVALIVVGPKDLPAMFRTLGRFTGKMRNMARDFQRAMDDAAKQTGLDETARDLKAMTSKKGLGLDALETAAAKFEKWDPVKKAAAPAATAQAAAAPVTPPPMPANPPKPAMGPATQALAEKVAAGRADRASAQAAKADAAAPAAPAAAKAAPKSATTAKPAAASRRVAPAKSGDGKADDAAPKARSPRRKKADT